MNELGSQPQGQRDSVRAAAAAVARLHALNDRLALYEKINWKAFRAKDPADAQEFWLQFMQTREARDALLRHLQQRSDDAASKKQSACESSNGHSKVTTGGGATYVSRQMPYRFSACGPAQGW